MGVFYIGGREGRCGVVRRLCVGGCVAGGVSVSGCVSMLVV